MHSQLEEKATMFCTMTRPSLSTPPHRRRTLMALAVSVLLALPAVGLDQPFGALSLVDIQVNGPRELAVFDWDGDGSLDILGAASIGDEVSLWRNAGNGTWVQTSPTFSLNGAWTVTTGDFDGDGTLDFAAGGSLADDVRVSLNRTPVFSLTVEDDFDGVRDLVTGDFDQDGDLDLAGVAITGDEMAWFENGGDGVTWTTRVIGPAVVGPESLAAADIDLDGDLDLMVGASVGGIVIWMENRLEDGSGWRLHLVATSLPGARGVAVGDIDGDGDPDVAVATLSSPQELRWLENPGPAAPFGTLWGAHAFSGIRAVATVDLADLDQDGDLDLLTGRWEPAPDDQQIRWYENTAGDGSVFTEHIVAGEMARAHDVLAADIDNDGDLEIVACASAGNLVAVFENESIHRSARFGRIETLPVATAANPKAGATADVDSDGDRDVIEVRGTRVLGWRDNPTGDFRIAMELSDVPNGAESVAVGDIDDDGDTDAVLALANGLVWVENRGTSQWNEHTISSMETGIERVEIVDADQNGIDDVITIDPTGGEVLFWRNTGDGSTWFRNTVTTFSGALHDVALADLDADGEHDVVLAEGALLRYYSRVADLAWPSTDIGMITASAIAALDIDVDGDLDVVVSDDPMVRMFINPGSSGSWTVANQALSGRKHLQVGDLDGDGDADLLATHGGSTQRLDNPRDGTLTSESAFTLSASKVEILDYDRDGDLDALGFFPGQETKIAWNDGGQFGSEGDGPPFLYPLRDGEAALLLTLDVDLRGRTGEPNAWLERLTPRFTDRDGVPLTQPAINQVISTHQLWRDDGDGVFDAANDTRFFQTAFTPINQGEVSIGPTLLNANSTIVRGGTARFFYVVDLSSASSAIEPDFDITLTPSAFGVQDADGLVPLRPEGREDIVRTVFTLPGSTLFADGFESGDTSAWSSQVP